MNLLTLQLTRMCVNIIFLSVFSFLVSKNESIFKSGIGIFNRKVNYVGTSVLDLRSLRRFKKLKLIGNTFFYSLKKKREILLKSNF